MTLTWHWGLEAEGGHFSTGDPAASEESVFWDFLALSLESILYFLAPSWLIHSVITETHGAIPSALSNRDINKVFLDGFKDLNFLFLLKPSWEKQCFSFRGMKRLTPDFSSLQLRHPHQEHDLSTDLLTGHRPSIPGWLQEWQLVPDSLIPG